MSAPATPTTPNVQALYLNRQGWGPNKGHLAGTVTFAFDGGSKVEIVVDGAIANRIVALCAEALVERSRAVASLMVADLIDSLPALLAGPEGRLPGSGE